MKRNRAQKHQNSTTFKNNMHDTSQRTQQLNRLEIHGVCPRCRDIIQWKIKYKKYKPLSAPAVCSHCHQRSVKAAYRHYCSTCAGLLGCCEKCGERSDTLVTRSRPNQTDRDRWGAEVQREVKGLPERYRRSLYRLVDASSWSSLEELEQLRQVFRERLTEVRALLDSGDDEEREEDGDEQQEEDDDEDTDCSENDDID